MATPPAYTDQLSQDPVLNPERLAYWYFRLNGVLTLANVVVHPDLGVGIRTDVDVLGVRFPFRRELLQNPMEDDPIFFREPALPFIIIGEAKSGLCAINQSWLSPDKLNLERVLSLIGAFQPNDNPRIAQAVRENGCYVDDRYRVSLLLIGSRTNEALRGRMPEVPQVTWRQIAGFIFQRFYRYRRQKLLHDQWDETGHRIWSIFSGSREEQRQFCDRLLCECRLPLG